MTIYYHALAADLPTGFVAGKRKSIDESRVLFSVRAYSYLSDTDKSVCVAFEQNDLTSFRQYLDSSSEWTVIDSEQQLAEQQQDHNNKLNKQLGLAVDAARTRYAPDRAFQDQAYLIKAEVIAAWDGVSDPPECLVVVAEKLHLEDLRQAQAAIPQIHKLWKDKLLETETLRERGQIAIDKGESINHILEALRDV